MNKLYTLLFTIISLSIISCKQNIAPTKVKIEPYEIKRPQVSENSFMMKMQSEALQSSFTGISTSTGKENNLYPITSSGVSTEPIVKAGENFISSLSDKQHKKTVFNVQNDEWRKWSNVDNGIFKRQGTSLKEMNKEQRQFAFDLIKVSLSAKGLQLSKDIMKTDQTLRELNNDNPIFDEELYFFTIMGKPSINEPWGWQLDGHHLIINYFVLGDQIVMTPTFMGGEPILTTTGKYKGNTLFQDEQNIGLKFMQSLSAKQQKQAIISKDKQHNDAKTEAFKDNVTLDYQGLKSSVLTETQKESLLKLTEQYISNMRKGHSEVKMEEIERHIDNTYFAWIGSTDEDAVFYYRIHSPVILIEFDHQGPIGVRSKERGATRNHIHTVVRTPNGNDYGKDLLHQHLEKHHH